MSTSAPLARLAEDGPAAKEGPVAEDGPAEGDQYGCIFTKVLMEHDFAFSYGQPFVGTKLRKIHPLRKF
jgi:hypothetical protein